MLWLIILSLILNLILTSNNRFNAMCACHLSNLRSQYDRFLTGGFFLEVRASSKWSTCAACTSTKVFINYSSPLGDIYQGTHSCRVSYLCCGQSPLWIGCITFLFMRWLWWAPRVRCSRVRVYFEILHEINIGVDVRCEGDMMWLLRRTDRGKASITRPSIGCKCVECGCGWFVGWQKAWWGFWSAAFNYNGILRCMELPTIFILYEWTACGIYKSSFVRIEYAERL